MKIIINRGIGYGWSDRAVRSLRRRGVKAAMDEVLFGEKFPDGSVRDFRDVSKLAGMERNDPVAVALLERFGSKQCSGRDAQLEIVEIPDGIDWEVESCEGYEWVSEKHRRWPED